MNRDSLGRSALRRVVAFCRDRRADTLIVFALSLPAMTGLVALGVEVGAWYEAKRSLQTAADAAALSGAWEKVYGRNSTIADAALEDAIRNGFDNAAPATITVNTPPLEGIFADTSTAVEVVLTIQPDIFLASVFLDAAPTIEARAVAAISGGNVCLLALRTSGDGVIKTSGSAIVDMPDCFGVTNSTGKKSVEVGGTSTFTAYSLHTRGKVHEAAGATLDLTEPAVQQGPSVPDPFSDLTIPAGLPPCQPGSFNDTRTIDPGTYCALSFGSLANVTLNPGTYYVDQGDFVVNGGATVDCNCSGTDGVTIVLTSTGAVKDIGKVTINGGSTVELKAPAWATYDYPGMLFIQDDRAGSGDNRFEGDSAMSLTGGIYFPAQRVQWRGNTSLSTPECTTIVADRIEFTGSSRASLSGCGNLGLSLVTMDPTATLVE